MDYSDVKGLFIMRPYGYAIWENIQKILDPASSRRRGHQGDGHADDADPEPAAEGEGSRRGLRARVRVGHDGRPTEAEARKETLQMLEIYAETCEQELAMPVIRGNKTDKEKFAGAENTYTIECMMHDHKALQSGTSHYFGDGFARAFDITYTDKNNQVDIAAELRQQRGAAELIGLEPVLLVRPKRGVTSCRRDASPSRAGVETMSGS